MAADSPLFPAACRVSVAPMMQRTDRHCRYFHRLLAPEAGLYTEMVHAQAVIHSTDGRFLSHHPAERPLALQLGGSEPEALAEATAELATAGGVRRDQPERRLPQFARKGRPFRRLPDA